MADNNDTGTQKSKTPQTPFGGWASAPPKGEDGNGAPKAVVTNADGSQRPAGSDDLSQPKYGAEGAQNQPAIRSFSATFGISIKDEISALPPVAGEESDTPTEATPANETGEQSAPAPAPQFAAEEPEEEQEEAAPPPPPAPEDPFAWNPQESGVSAEPRRQTAKGGDWMAAETSYEELQSANRAATEAAEKELMGEVIEEEITPTVNPYTFGKEDEWVAPPMSAEELAALEEQEQEVGISEEKPVFEFNTQVTAKPAEEETAPQEGQPLSPFELSAFSAEEEEQTTTENAFDTMPEETLDAAPVAEAPAAEETPAVAETPVENTPAPEEHKEQEAPVSSAKTTFTAYKPKAAQADATVEDSAPAEQAEPHQSTPPVADDFAAPAASEWAEPTPLLADEPVETPAAEVPAEAPTAMEWPQASEQPAATASPTEDISSPFAMPQAEESPFVSPEATEEQPTAASETSTNFSDFALQTNAPLPEEESLPSTVQDAGIPEETPAWDAPLAAETPMQDQPLPEESPIAEPQSWDAQPENAYEQPHTEAPIEPIETAFSAAPQEEPARPATSEAEAEPFGAGAGETTEGMLAAAQADIPQEEIYAASPAPLSGERAQPVGDIAAILQEHMNWLNSNGKDGRRANFRNADLQQQNLSNCQLAEASFRGANLTGANLSGSDLRGADLSEARLNGADLSITNLAGAIFSRADLRTALFSNADLQGADFSGASLIGAVLSGLNLGGGIFLDTDMQSADLSQTNLAGANMRGANLTYANLSSANLSQANCRDVRFDQAILDNAVFEGVNLKNATLQGASLLGTDLTTAGETSPEQQQETLMAEKDQIQQEWQRLKEHEAQVMQLQATIQQREMALQTDRVNNERARRELRGQHEGLEKLIGKTREVMERHRVHDRLFKYFGITWFIFSILIVVSVMLFISALQLKQLDWLELSIVFGGCALIMGLFIATTIRSIKLSNNLKQLLDVYEQQSPPSDKAGH